MKTGDTVRDGQGATWQVGQFLGRGTWGRSWIVRRESDDATFVLKTSLGPEDFRGEVAGADALYAASREAVMEQARVLGEARHPFLPRLEARLTLGDGQPAYVVPRFADTLEKRIHEGITFSQLVEVLVAVARLAQPMGSGHGGIKPSNVLFSERGEMFLADPATPAVHRNLHRFVAANPAAAMWYPPEFTETATEAAWTSGVDGWGLAMMVWRGAVAGDVVPNPPRHGLDKAAQVSLRDKLTDRMKTEDSNPRFHARFSERVAVLVARALSREAAPSPPFRFPRLDELTTRLEEVGALIRPSVSQVGKVLLDRPANKPWFSTDEEVSYTCTVGTSAGVEGPEEIGVGLAVFDLDKDERLKDLDLAYTVDKHPGAYGPTARWRFSFKIKGLGPGRYRIRIAFAIRDSGQPPATAEAEVTVTAAPGWVPKGGAAPEAAAIPFPREPEPNTAVTQVRAEPRTPIASPNGMAPRPAPPGLKESGSPADANPRTVSTTRVGEPPRPADTTPAGGGPRPIPPAQPTPEADTGVKGLPPMGTPHRVAPRIASPDSPRTASPEPPRAAPPVAALPRPVAAAAAEPAAETSPPPAAPTEVEEEPSWRPPPRREWVDEPLPNTASRDVADEDDTDLDPEDDEPGEPNLLSRVYAQLKNDAYIAVMAGLGLIVLILLVVLLTLRE